MRTAAPTTEVRALAADPSNAEVAYAGSWNAEGGVYKTTDGGASWTRISNGMPARAGIAALAVDPTNPQHVAAATYWYGVYLSTDGGQTWKLAANGMPTLARQRLDDVDFDASGKLYAASHHGVFVFGPGPAGAPLQDVLPGTLPATGAPWFAGAGVLLLVAGLSVRRRIRSSRSTP